jgi:hypothetical protein
VSFVDGMVQLHWKKYKKLTEARREFAKKPCVYVQTDPKGRPVRVGKATKGLEARYRGGTGYAIDAAMHSSENLVFVAYVPAKLCGIVESNLIWAGRAVLIYNNLGKKTEPSHRLRFDHSGKSPDFSAFEK